jgi:hypothetical protein
LTMSPTWWLFSVMRFWERWACSSLATTLAACDQRRRHPRSMLMELSGVSRHGVAACPSLMLTWIESSFVKDMVLGARGG